MKMNFQKGPKSLVKTWFSFSPNTSKALGFFFSFYFFNSTFIILYPVICRNEYGDTAEAKKKKTITRPAAVVKYRHIMVFARCAFRKSLWGRTVAQFNKRHFRIRFFRMPKANYENTNHHVNRLAVCKIIFIAQINSDLKHTS